MKDHTSIFSVFQFHHSNLILMMLRGGKLLSCYCTFGEFWSQFANILLIVTTLVGKLQFIYQWLFYPLERQHIFIITDTQVSLKTISSVKSSFNFGCLGETEKSVILSWWNFDDDFQDSNLDALFKGGKMNDRLLN